MEGRQVLEVKAHYRKEFPFNCLTVRVDKEKDLGCGARVLEVMKTRPIADENEELRDSKDIKALGLRPRALY